jgi:hypothetical protein
MKKEIVSGLFVAGCIIALSLAAAFARRHGYVDGDTSTRVVIGLNGLILAWFGNRLPKTVVPNACSRQGKLVAGWSMVLSGLIYAGLWAFAPIPLAITYGSGAVLMGIAVTFGYCLWLRAGAKAA